MEGPVDYEAVFEGVADGLVLHDPETGAIVDANERYREMHGYSKAEFEELTVDDLTADDWEPPTAPAELVRRAASEGVQTFEWRNEGRDGDLFWSEVTLSTVTFGDSEYVLASVRDVSERKQSERQAALYETVVQRTGDGVLVVDTDRRVEYVNPRVVELTGVPQEEWLGRSIGDVVLDHDLASSDTIERFRRLFDEFLASGDDHVRLDIEAPEGLLDAIDVHLTAVCHDERTRVVATVRDISERLEYEHELERRTEQLEVLNRVVRHDIRNDMTVVLAWLEELETHVDEAGVASFERVEQASEHVVELTEIARDYVDVIVGDGDVTTEPTDLEAVLVQEIQKCAESYPNAEFHLDEPVPDAPVAADEMFTSVVRNLLNNAVQHNDEETPDVRVSVERDDDVARLRVADNGPGVPDSQKETIFGKGEQGLDSPGSGIGLYLVHSLVEQYGGDVWVEDREPKGAVFVVELPVA